MANQMTFPGIITNIEGQRFIRVRGIYIEDLTGRRFRRLVVTDKAPSNGKSARWVCRCDCGNIRIARGHDLRRGKAVSCGCARSEWSEERRRKLSRARKGLRLPGAGRPVLNIAAGSKFGRWLVIGLGKRRGPHITWLCECECGMRRTVAGSELRLGRSRSCGCLSRDMARARMLKTRGLRVG